ncbi:MAG: hypothetical protein MJ248_05755 [Bacilli bacterium]|nr:hypothetical protein [Bacilli bacterium]
MKLKKIVIVPGFICIFANLISLFTFTYSWFAHNNQVEATGMQVKCEDPHMLQFSYNIYEFNMEANQGAKTETFELGSYDKFIESRNVKLAKILEITIRPAEGVDYTENQTLTVEIPCTSTFLGSDNKIASKISNLVTFKTARFGYQLNDTYSYDVSDIYGSDNLPTSDNTFYTKAVEYFNNCDSQEFVSDPTNKALSQVQKTDLITFSNIEVPAHFQELKIAVEYTYSKTLVDYFYDNNDEKIEIKDLTGAAIPFTNDIEYFLLNLI